MDAESETKIFDAGGGWCILSRLNFFVYVCMNITIYADAELSDMSELWILNVGGV